MAGEGALIRSEWAHPLLTHNVGELWRQPGSSTEWVTVWDDWWFEAAQAPGPSGTPIRMLMGLGT
jgi:hypothetical protein